MAPSDTGTLEDVFRLIARSGIGREILSRFMPEYQKGLIRIHELEEASPQLIMLKVDGMAGSPAGGFLYVEGRKEIFLLKHPALGVRAPLLFHEMVHATDEVYLASFAESTALWNGFRKRAETAMKEAAARMKCREDAVMGGDLKQEVRLELLRLKRKAEAFDRIRLFRTERKAYTALYQWTQEISERLPEYREWLRGTEARGFHFDRQITDSEISEGYGLNPAAA
jgi:hypothetical protein